MKDFAIDEMSTNRKLRVADLMERVSLCRFLGQLYRRELDGDMVEGLGCAGVFAHLEQHGFELGSERLDDPDHLQELGLEYTRLFIGPGPHIPLYGSVHHPEDPRQGQLWGKTTKEVRAMARDHGLGFDGASYDGIPDHLGHLLEFLAHLLRAELDAAAAGKTKLAGRLKTSQQMLLSRYLMPWVPAFCEKVRTKARFPFYSELARLTDEFLQGEQQLLPN